MNTHQDIPASAPQHTTVIRSEQAVASVTFAPPEDGRWFRVLNSVVDRGEWASLSPAASKVLIVLARHAGQDGTSFPDSAAVEAASGLKRSAVYKALAELEREAGLIERDAGGRGYRLFPHRPYAARLPHRSRGESTSVDNLHELRRKQSTGVDDSSTIVDKKSTSVDSPKSKRDLEGDEEGAPRENQTGNGGGGEISEAVKRLTDEGGMSPDEALGFVARFGVAMAIDSLDNAIWRKRSGKLSGPVKAYAWHAAQKGYGPFREVRAEREAAEVEAAARELKGILDARLSREESARVAAVFGSCRRAIAFGVLTPRDVRTRDAGDVARLVASAAAACEGHAPPAFKRVLAEARRAGVVA